jgi:16S rRNA (guanine527-N7)-methyltransferase
MESLSLISHYFPELSPAQLELFRQLEEGYREWNPKVNLVSRTDLENLEERHILHSLAPALFFPFEPMTEIMDLGTGGGFPGLPLAIMYPESNFLLVDSIGKKIRVVEDLAGRLNVKNVRVYNARAEQVQETFDFVVTRAVAPAEDLVRWTRGKFARHFNHSLRNGILAWKGGDLSTELKAIAPQKPKIFHLKNYLKEEFFSTKQIVHIPMA